MDADSLWQRIVTDLSVIFKREAQIIEFDIIPVENSIYNKSPVIQIQQRLGLESWCVKHVYNYAYRKFFNCRRSQKKDLYAIEEWTRALILINPDLTTAWNARKELVLDGLISPLVELRFSEIVLTRKPKAPDNFTHREWLIKFILRKEILSEEFIRNELRISLDAASRYHCNYFSWSHRYWIIKHLSPTSINVLKNELQTTKQWLESHISDYSCFHYRQTLFSFIYNSKINLSDEFIEEGAFVKHLHLVLNSELQNLNGLLELYPDQESLFYHRRFVVNALIKWFQDEANIKSSEMLFLKKQLLAYEKSGMNGWRLEVTKRYFDYVKRTHNWSLDKF